MLESIKTAVSSVWIANRENVFACNPNHRITKGLQYYPGNLFKIVSLLLTLSKILPGSCDEEWQRNKYINLEICKLCLAKTYKNQKSAL